MGALVRLLYNAVSVLDSKVFSAYSISIILSTIIFKFIVMPLTLKQTRSMKKMQEMGPQIKELQEKYGKDPQTMQRKQMELYKEANYNPASGCLPLLIQMPILISFFYVLQQPVKFIFQDQAFYDSINKSFLWIKDLGFAENFIFDGNLINGLSMGMSLPFVGAAFPILAAITGISTYLTSKMSMSGQPVMNEQQMASQKTMTVMMPIMIFVMSLNFPSGLGLYWVISNVFQLVQQYVIMHSSKKSAEELK
jgi:YidC/Oxa1 family membrane protein insertase